LNEGRTAAPHEARSEPQQSPPADAFRIALPSFEGPLDLLLHLIKEHELDIFDIPIALITEKYIEYLKAMRELNLDIAGEFLVMASTLAHIKSRLLLPVPQAQGDLEPEEQGDPRAELVRRLLEYQKYKEAGEMFLKQDILGKDAFARRVAVARVPLPEDDPGLVEIDVYRLIQALDGVLKRIGPELRHEVIRDRVSISDAIHALLDRLQRDGTAKFLSLFEGFRSRSDVVVTFLAVLEMCRLRLIRVLQEPGGELIVSAIATALSPANALEVDESEYS
jgi:segregation and condensation protein A